MMIQYFGMLGRRLFCVHSQRPGILPRTKSPLSRLLPAHTAKSLVSPIIPALTKTPGGGYPSRRFLHQPGYDYYNGTYQNRTENQATVKVLLELSACRHLRWAFVSWPIFRPAPHLAPSCEITARRLLRAHPAPADFAASSRSANRHPAWCSRCA